LRNSQKHIINILFYYFFWKCFTRLYKWM